MFGIIRKKKVITYLESEIEFLDELIDKTRKVLRGMDSTTLAEERIYHEDRLNEYINRKTQCRMILQRIYRM